MNVLRNNYEVCGVRVEQILSLQSQKRKDKNIDLYKKSIREPINIVVDRFTKRL